MRYFIIIFFIWYISHLINYIFDISNPFENISKIHGKRCIQPKMVFCLVLLSNDILHMRAWMCLSVITVKQAKKHKFKAAAVTTVLSIPTSWVDSHEKSHFNNHRNHSIHFRTNKQLLIQATTTYAQVYEWHHLNG